MTHKRLSFGIVLIFVFMVSAVTLFGTSSQTAISGTSVKTINWEVRDESFSDEFDWSSSGWQFGPTPSYSLTYANDTPVGREDTVWDSDAIKITIKVPLDAITTGNDLGEVGVSFNYWEEGFDQDPTTGDRRSLWSFSIYGDYSYRVQDNSWNKWTYQDNFSYSDFGFPAYVEKPAPKNKPLAVEKSTFGHASGPDIFLWNTATRTASLQDTNSDGLDDTWIIFMEGNFNASLPAGRWNFNLRIVDSEYQWIEPGYFAWDSDQAPWRDLWLDAPFEEFDYFGFGDGFTAQQFSNTGELLLVVDREVPVQFQYNITTPTGLDTVIWKLDLPYQYNQSGSQQFYDRGVYNATGYYLGTEQLFLMYDSAANGGCDCFTQKIGYVEWVEIQVDDGFGGTYTNWIEQLNILRNPDSNNITDSMVGFNSGVFQDLGNDEYRVTFNVTLNASVLDGTKIYYSSSINNTNGDNIWSYDQSGWGELSVKTPIVFLEIFDDNKNPADQFGLRVKDGEFFYLNFTLQGHPDVNMLNNISIRLQGWDSTWSEVDQQSTNVGFRLSLRYDLVNDTLTLEAFNETTRYSNLNGGTHEYYDQGLGQWEQGWPTSPWPYYSEFGVDSTNLLQIAPVNRAQENDKLILAFNISLTSQTPEMRFNLDKYSIEFEPWEQVTTFIGDPAENLWGYEMIFGNPSTNMWGFNVWTVNPDNGALDLDGDLETTNDQYFVLKSWDSTNSWSENVSRMWVDLYWDPDTNAINNEYNLNGWMGFTESTWTWDWAENYFWYHASSLIPVTQTEMDAIQTAVLADPGNSRESNPGYWEIGWMAQNFTQSDLVQEALDNGWDWIPENSWSTSWLDFGFSQNYFTHTSTSNEFGLAKPQDVFTYQSLRNEWTGFFLYNDTTGDGIPDFDQEEVSHMFIPNNVGSVLFTTPGSAFGNTANSGFIQLTDTDTNWDTTIDFGIKFVDVTGTTFPVLKDAYGNWMSIWAWTQGGVTGTDFTSFADRPTGVTIEDVSFQLHFDIDQIAASNILSKPSQTSENNVEINLKLDQEVGAWDTDNILGQGALENYSLAITYLSAIESAAGFFTVADDNGNTVDNTQTVESDGFSYTANNVEFASAILAGDYDWSKDSSIRSSATYSAPIGQFQESYQSDNGDGSSFGFDFSSELYFLAIGFPNWDGYRVVQDPTFSAVSAVSGVTQNTGTTSTTSGGGNTGGTSTSTGSEFTSAAPGFTLPTVLFIGAIIGIVVVRRRKQSI